jgi:uncharacterized protein (DUF1778 family)
MMTASETKNARIEFKTTVEIKALLQEAAQSLGVDLSSFLLMTATQRARQIVREEKLLRLEEEEWERFASLLVSPPPATEALKALMRSDTFDG